MKILIVEDDAAINQLLQQILIKEGFEVVTAYSGTEGALRLEAEQFDLMVTDLMLPGLTGEELIGKAREKAYFPIIALSAKSNLDDKINVLGMGADDYLVKPFEPRELVARIQVQLRKLNQKGTSRLERSSKLSFKQLVLDEEARTTTVEGHLVELTSHEFEIIKTMLAYPTKVFSKEALYESVWKDGYYGEDSTISVHVSNIRKKIAAHTDEVYISTVWGIGYKLNT